MKNVLVTGATGFVGSHALEAMSAQGDTHVIAACRDSSRLPQDFNGEVRVGDLRDETYIASLLDGVDTICNAFAWTALYGHARESKELYLKPTIHFIDAAIKAGVSRFINISTTSAASPNNSADAMSKGISRSYFPHLNNVIIIENYLREKAGPDFTVINLRFGVFAGNRYALGLLPILLPRLKTHLVPWVAGGQTSMPFVDGHDIGQAISKSVQATNLLGYQSFNIVGPSVPKVRDVIELIHNEYGYPKPHFSVPFPVAFAFAWLMELIDPIVPWEPLITRSIVHLLREVNANNQRAEKILGYKPKYYWHESVRNQIEEMSEHQKQPMSMAKPIDKA